jgi:hypothetical protein
LRFSFSRPNTQSISIFKIAHQIHTTNPILNNPYDQSACSFTTIWLLRGKLGKNIYRWLAKDINCGL